MTRELSIALQSDEDLATYTGLAPRIEELGFGTVSVYRDLLYPSPLLPLIIPRLGLTLTAADTVIWFGPTTKLETYEQANAATNDWLNVSAVRVRVTFVNPLFGAPNQPVTTPQYIVVERVIQVMSRAGDYT